MCPLCPLDACFPYIPYCKYIILFWCEILFVFSIFYLQIMFPMFQLLAPDNPIALTWRTNALMCLIQSVQEMTPAYYSCWIPYQQPKRDVEPSLQKLKGQDQSFSNWVRHDCQARKRVMSIFSCVFYLILTFQFFLKVYYVCWHVFTCFFVVGVTAASTCWNTLQSGKVDEFLSSQTQL